MDSAPGLPQSVLVIDDDPLMRELLNALFEAEGVAVSAVESGAEAMEWLRKAGTSPEVALTDIQMPDTEPKKLIADLRGVLPPETLLLGMSGSPARPEEVAALDGFLLKPFSTEAFFALAGKSARDKAIAREDDTKKSSVLPSAAAATSRNDQVPVLDTAVYNKLATSLPANALRELYGISLDDVQHRTETIRAAHERGDHETCRREAHAIKGGCGMVGAMELRAEAEALEGGAPADSFALERLHAASDRLRRMLDTLP